jgi:hypothetical protein
MNFKTTLFLLVLLAIVGVFFLWDKDHPGVDVDAPQVDQTKQPMFDAAKFDKDKIASLTIEKDGATSVITKEGSDWQQTEPVMFKLNSWSAGQPGERALALTYTEKLTPGSNGAPTLAEVNLDKPLATVTVKFNDDTPQQVFKLGRKSVGGRAYLMLNDDKALYVVNDELHKSILDEKITEWRNKSLKAPAEGQINQLTKTDSHGNIQLAKADGNWAFAGSHSGRVARQAVTDLLGAINGIYIAKFVADKPQDLSAYGLDQPAVKVTLELPAAQSKTEKEAKDQKAADSKADTTPRYQTFVIGAPVDLKKERYFATFADGQGVGDVVFEISKSDYDKFDKDVDALREARITPLVTADVTKLTIADSKAAKLQLLKSPSGWGYGDPKPGYGLDQDLAKELLNAVTDAKAETYTVNPKLGNEPMLKVTLSATGHASDDVLSIYDGDKDYTVIRNNETVGYNVPKDKFAKITGTTVALLRNRTIKDWKPTDLKMVAITLPDSTQLHFTRTDAAWKLDGYDKHESIALGELLDAVAPLKADSWETAGPVGDNVYTLTYGNDDQTLSLKIDPDTRIAMLEEPSLSFMVSQNVIDKLKAELRPREIVSVTRDAIQKVQVVTKDQNITIEQKDGKFTAENVKLDEAKAGSLFDTLAGLRVEHFTVSSKISRPIDVIITTKDQTIHLQLSDDYSGQIGATSFTLSEGDFNNLTATFSK